MKETGWNGKRDEMPDLKKTIRALTEEFACAVADDVQAAIRERAAEFADKLLETIGSASLSDIVSSTTRAELQLPPHRASRQKHRKGERRSAAEIDDLAKEIVDLCKKHPGGIKAEEMRAVLKVENRELQRPIFLLLKRGNVKKTGQKRSTLYFAAA